MASSKRLPTMSLGEIARRPVLERGRSFAPCLKAFGWSPRQFLFLIAALMLFARTGLNVEAQTSVTEGQALNVPRTRDP